MRSPWRLVLGVRWSTLSGFLPGFVVRQGAGGFRLSLRFETRGQAPSGFAKISTIKKPSALGQSAWCQRAWSTSSL